MTPDEIIEDMIKDFRGEGLGRRIRKYVGGLLPAFCDFLLEIPTPGRGFSNFDAFLAEYPLITEGVSTLTVRYGKGQKTIRPAYERIHHFYIFEKSVLASRGPHLTRQASGATTGIGWMLSSRSAKNNSLRSASGQSSLCSMKWKPSSSILRWFVWTRRYSSSCLSSSISERERKASRRGPSSKRWCSVSFADAPHLQVEARKVRAGSARTKGIGDIDAWEGDRLIISAEVKHFVVSMDQVATFEHFSHEIRQRAALGMIVAEGFQDGVREAIEEKG